MWNDCLQDVGCKESILPGSRYRRAKILSVGLHGDELLYYHLTAIAVDYAKGITTLMQGEMAWKKLPGNPVNTRPKFCN